MRRTAHSFSFNVVPRGACHKFPRSREDPTSHHVSPSHDRRRHHADRGARSRLDAARSDLRGRSRDLSCPFASFLFARWGFFCVEADRVSTPVGRRPSRAPSIASSPPASPPTSRPAEPLACGRVGIHPVPAPEALRAAHPAAAPDRLGACVASGARIRRPPHRPSDHPVPPRAPARASIPMTRRSRDDRAPARRTPPP